MSLEIISPKNHILKNWKTEEIKNQIIERIKQFPNYSQYKADVEFLLMVCNLVEYLVNKKDKISKKELLLEIYNNVFPLNPDEVKNIEANVDFLWNNKKIKKVSFYKLFKTNIYEWVKRKIL
jgi:hypothetical protein